jgi:hypothetical protein
MGTGAGNRRQNELDAGKAANYDPAVRQRFDSWYHDAISKGYVMVVTSIRAGIRPTGRTRATST